jgi:adenosylcobinamide-phosphate synthase
MDDVMNFIPARLTALFMILASYLPGKDCVTAAGQTVRIPDGAAAYRIWRRDRLKSPSPNSAQTESVCAGALHLRLLGDTWYFGKLHHKPEIGDGGRKAEPCDITRAVRLMNRTAFLMFVTGISILLLTGILG